MTNPTSNYGWVLPTATDLVTDLPADFDVALQGVDTTTKALNPETTLGDIAYRSATANTNTRLGIGSTGQVLTVAGGVPSWASPSDQTPLTTKGDLFTYTTTDARLGVGANDTVLIADSTAATGLKWGTPSAALNIQQIATGTLSGSGVSLTSLSTYDTLELRITGANVSANDQNLRLYMNADNTGANWEYAVSQVGNRTAYNAPDFDGYQQTGGFFPLTSTLGLMTANTSNRFFMRLTNCKSAGMTFVDYWAVYKFSAGGTVTNATATGSAIWKTTAAISSLQFNSQFNTFSAGTYTLWGA